MYENDHSEVTPPLSAAQERVFEAPGSPGTAEGAREDLAWCSAPGSDGLLDGRYLLAALSSAADGRLVKVEVEADVDGLRDLNIETQYDPVRKLHVNMVVTVGKKHTKNLSAGYEVLKIGAVPVARRGQEALEHALDVAAKSTTVMVVAQRPLVKAISSAESKASKLVSEAQAILDDVTVAQLEVREGKRAAKMIKHATRMGAINLLQMHTLATSMSRAAFRHTAQRETGQGGNEDGGTRSEFLELSVPLLAKTLDMTLSMINEANAQPTAEKRDYLKKALDQKAGLRPSMQAAKLTSFLIWLDRTDEACSIADLGVEEGVFGRADQACSKCTRGEDGEAMMATVPFVPRGALPEAFELLEGRAEDIKAEWTEVGVDKSGKVVLICCRVTLFGSAYCI
jgi:hypothetical protein